MAINQQIPITSAMRADAKCQHRQHPSLLSAETRPIPRHSQTSCHLQAISLARSDSVACSGSALALAHTTGLLYLRHYHILCLNIPCSFRTLLFASPESHTVTPSPLVLICTDPWILNERLRTSPTTCLSHEHTDRSSARFPRLHAHRAPSLPST